MANQINIKNQKVSIGDGVSVHQIIKEENKTRKQIFKGIVISIKGSGEGKTFTVRKIGAAGVGVERIWPINSPWIEKVEVNQEGIARRAKLYHLRQKIGKEAVRIKTK
ncbi:MAG: 50S ribosomal protein L19 [Patescibacteria group bacterium]|nr:50S ribosomal protein L19 [Patescibacteria group bacterium]